MQAKRVADTYLQTAQLMTPNDANTLGKVFGGRVLALIDLAAAATAMRFAENIVVTAAFERVDFHEPISIGELVTFSGHVSYVGRTSIEVTIDVSATNVIAGTTRATNSARVTMVALKDGKPVEVPRLVCETREEKLSFIEGRLRRELRGERTKERAELIEIIEALPNHQLDELLAMREPLKTSGVFG